MLVKKLGQFRLRGMHANLYDRQRQQHIRTLHEAEFVDNSGCPLLKVFKQKRIHYIEGSYVYYIPPQNNSWLRKILQGYPVSAALKVLKTSGTAENRLYSGLGGKPIALKLLGMNSYEMLYSCNYLNLLGVTPRIYDLAYIKCNGKRYVTFVVQHISGDKPDRDECRRFLERIRELIHSKILSIISVKPWYKTKDFQYPDCTGNMMTDDSGAAYYVDFQNLSVNREKVIEDVIESARISSHFGSEYIVRKGRYLYQSIPNFAIYGKRDTEIRWRAINDMLLNNDLELNEKVVFDVGCNIGMVMGACLTRGAFWCIGWDKPGVVSQTQKVLAILGYTRFTLLGVDLDEEHRFEEGIPTHLMNKLDRSFLFFLSMRIHIGFPPRMFRLPWRYMVYEDHQREVERIDKHLSKINKIVPVRVLSRCSISDGDSSNRPLVLLERL